MSVKDKIRGFLSADLKANGFGDDDNLLAAEIIDSLRMLDLISFLESEFTVQIDEDELMPDNFESLNAITSFVESKKVA